MTRTRRSVPNGRYLDYPPIQRTSLERGAPNLATCRCHAEPPSVVGVDIAVLIESAGSPHRRAARTVTDLGA